MSNAECRMQNAELAPDGGIQTAAAGGDPSTRADALAQDDIQAIPAEPVGVVMADDVKLLGQYLAQLGHMMATMQKRMDEMEARQRQVTASHEEVKRIQRVIRWRAGEICDKYQLTDPESGKILRAAIKKDILNRWGVKDLHDLPERALDAVRAAVGSWVNIRLVMERRTQG